MLIIIIVSECKRKYEIAGSGQVIIALCSLEDVPIYLDWVSQSEKQNQRNLTGTFWFVNGNVLWEFPFVITHDSRSMSSIL